MRGYEASPISLVPRTSETLGDDIEQWARCPIRSLFLKGSPMFSSVRSIAFALIFASVAGLWGCQSGGKSTLTADSMAVRCPKCQTVWVQTPGSKPAVVRSQAVHACPDCDKLVVAYLGNAAAPHHCAKCDVDLERCDVCDMKGDAKGEAHHH